MEDREQSAKEQLATPVQFLKGVGPDRAEMLQRLGLQTAQDVLFFFPRDYQDMSRLCSVDDLKEGELSSVCGTVEEKELRNTGPGRSMLGVLIRNEREYLRAVWFNQGYMAEKFQPGQQVLLSGEPKLRGGRWVMTHPRVEWLAEDEQLPAGRILPVYALTEGIKQSQIRRIVRGVVETHADFVDEVFPRAYLQNRQLCPIHDALRQIHSPADDSSLKTARWRFVYQELFVMQLALAMRRYRLQNTRQAPSLVAEARIDARIFRLFPFELTNGQKQAIAEIGADMGRSLPMNRLLQGEVGSGKTVVAIYAMLLTVAHEFQAALMAPTDVLARQHARTFADRLSHSRVRITLLTGTLTPAERREALASIKAGDVDLVIGTHAIIQSDVEFAKLGLVVIDEQHKFGVRQRATLRQAGLDPHYLVMTATPIPRTVSMTVFGDLDVSTIRESPPGRQPVHTYLANDEKRSQWWEFVRKKLGEGRQCFAIAPLVSESESQSCASAEQLYEQLSGGELQGFRLGLVHGQMSVADKEATMQAFGRNDVSVLVATSVVEVGIDIPNATVMTIESGERFGLSQLHQLRGRISRGSHPGYLCVFADAQTADAQQRLDAFAKTNDGFELADVDFQLRGPGDLFGTRQHGLPPLRIADLRRDTRELDAARRDARELIAGDPELAQPEYALLRERVISRYGSALDLGDVG